MQTLCINSASTADAAGYGKTSTHHQPCCAGAARLACIACSLRYEECLLKKYRRAVAGVQGNIDFKSAPWPSISEAAKDCVRKLLTMDPAQRPTAQQILEARCPAPNAGVPTHPSVIRRAPNMHGM